MHQFPVGLGMNRDRLDAQLLASPENTQGDLATIGDENLVQHV